MSCTVKFNEFNTVEEVLTKDGKKSILNENLNKSILVGNKNIAWDIQKNSYSSQIEKKYKGITDSNYVYETGEPKLFYKKSNVVSEDLEEVILSSQGIDTIQLGFKDPKSDKFIEVASIGNTGSSNNIQAFTIDQVTQGKLEATKVLVDGEFLYKGKGGVTSISRINAQYVVDSSALLLDGKMPEINYDGTFSLNSNKGLHVAYKNGVAEVIPAENLAEALKANEYDNKVDLWLQLQIANDFNIQPAAKKEKAPRKSEDELKSSLVNLLKKLGFTATSIDNYRKNYNERFGEDSTVNALADISRKVVAFGSGQYTTDNLTEEVAHVIIELYKDQNSLDTLLADVVNHPEYNEFAEQYREKYKEHFSNDSAIETEDRVRREILGKILQKKIQDSFSTEETTPQERTLIGKLMEMFRDFVQKVQNYFRPHHASSFERIMDDMVNSLTEEKLDKFTESELPFKDRIFFNMAPADTIDLRISLQQLALQLDRNLRSALNDRRYSSTALVDIENDIQFTDQLLHATDLLGLLQGDAQEVIGALDVLTSDSLLDSENRVRAQSILKTKTLIAQSVNHLRQLRNYDADATQRVDTLLNGFNKLQADLASIEGRVEIDSDNFVKKLMTKMIDDLDVSEKQKDDFRGQLTGTLKDIGMLSRIFGLPSNSKNIFIGALVRKAFDVLIEAKGRTIKRATPFITNMTEAKYKKHQANINKKLDGEATHYHKHMINKAQYHKDFENVQIDKIAEVAEVSRDVAEKAFRQKEWQELKGMNTEKVDEVLQAIKDFQAENEKPINDSYIKERDARHDRAGLSDFTKDLLQRKSIRRREIFNKARTEDGRIDKTQLTTHDLNLLHDIEREHKRQSAAFGFNGELKVGLDRKTVAEMTEADFASLNMTPEDLEVIKQLDPSRTITLLSQTEVIPTEEAQMAFELQKLSLITTIDIESGSLDFNYDAALVEGLESTDSAYQWAFLNGNFAFSDEFYSELDGTTSFVDRIQVDINSEEDVDARHIKQNLLEDYKEFTSARRELLKQNRVSGSPVETNYDRMPVETREAIVKLDEKISSLSKSLRPAEDVESPIDFETQFTEQFAAIAKHEGKTSLQLAKEHMPQDKSDLLGSYRLELRRFFAGGALNSLSLSRLVNNLSASGVLNSEAIDEETLNFLESASKSDFFKVSDLIDKRKKGAALSSLEQELLDSFRNPIKENMILEEFAKRNVHSYFKISAPQGYQDMIESFKQDPELTKQFILNRDSAVKSNPSLPLKYLTYNPGFSWREGALEEGKASENKNYDKNGGRVQPNLQKYADKEFFNHYGINMDAWLANPEFDLNNLTATRNMDEFTLLQQVTDMNKTIIENYGDTGIVDPSLRQQMRKEDLEKKVSYVKKGSFVNLKDSLWDIVANRRDEMQYGEVIESKNLKDENGKAVVGTIQVVPKYYQQMIEDPGTLSEGSIGTSVIALKQSEIYKSRMEKKAELEAITDFIERQQYEEAGASKIFKKGQASNSALMAREYLNYSLYGVKENSKMEVDVFGKTVDVASTVRSMTRFVGDLNLKYNPVVDATSLTTGALFTKIESVVNEHFSKDSFQRGEKQLYKILLPYLKESGKINKESKLHKLLERFDIEQIEERVSNSLYNKAGRLYSKSGYGISKLANMPVTPKVLLAGLNDYRMYNGSLITYRQFLEIKKTEASNEDKPFNRKALRQDWKGLSEDTFFNMLDLDSDVLTYNNKFAEFAKKDFPNLEGEELDTKVEERFNQYVNTIAAKTKTIASRVDGMMNQTDQVMLQRHFIGSLTMLHKGWLFLNLGSRFKSRHVNFMTNNIEQGHWTGLMKSFGAYLKHLKKSQFNPAKAYNEFRDESTYEEYKNFKRFITEMAILGTMIMGGLLLLSDDDEDDTELTTAFKFLYMRTFAEFNSTHLAGFPGLVSEQIKDPIVISRQVKGALAGTWDIGVGALTFDGDQIKEGWKDYKKLILPIKRYDKLSDLKGYYHEYLHFNQDNLSLLATEGKNK